MQLINTNFEIQKLQHPTFDSFGIELHIARLDLIHPIVSGNKIFKLHYFIEDCIRQKKKKILTFGGAYSNHLVATAYYAKELGIKSLGIIRGEQPSKLSHTLEHCKAYGMELHFFSRSMYSQYSQTPEKIQHLENIEDLYIIPEGGYHPLGALGSSMIIKNSIMQNADYLCTAVGTATTLAGLLLKSNEQQKIIAIPVLKNMMDLHEKISFLTNGKSFQNLSIYHDYHFGGYAKKDITLLNFMNKIYNQYQLPTDFVYTAKMLYGVFDLIKKKHFTNGSKIVCLHTGGLQGNLSLAPKTLLF